jgi:hypothetical protein
MANGDLKVGVDDIVASAASGVLRAFEARKVRIDDARFSDLVASGFHVRFEIWAGGLTDLIRAGGGHIGGGGGPLAGGGGGFVTGQG